MRLRPTGEQSAPLRYAKRILRSSPPHRQHPLPVRHRPLPIGWPLRGTRPSRLPSTAVACARRHVPHPIPNAHSNSASVNRSRIRSAASSSLRPLILTVPTPSHTSHGTKKGRAHPQICHLATPCGPILSTKSAVQPRRLNLPRSRQQRRHVGRLGALLRWRSG